MTGMSDLPSETISIVCGHLVPQHERFFSGKDDLLTAGQLNHTWNAAARRLLFRDITITFTLKDALPKQAGPWQPQPWDTPGVVRLLKSSPAELKGAVKNTRLRLYPFVVQQTWRTDDFNGIRERLTINTRNWPPAGPTLAQLGIMATTRRDFPRSVQHRQAFVMHEYDTLYQARCFQPTILPWTQDVEPLLQPFLAQLPNLERMETADAESSPAFIRYRLMHQWSVSYTNALLLRTAPRSVRSVCYRSWPPRPALVDIGGGDFTSPAGVHRRLQDFVDRRGQITELTIDCEMNHSTNNLIHATLTLDIWRRGLRQLQHLTTLTLVRTRYQKSPMRISHELPVYAYLGQLDPNLDHLLDRALVLQNVKALALVRWVLPATNFLNKMRSSFPALETLGLHGVAMWPNGQQAGERVWRECVDALRHGDSVAVVVEQPMVIVNGTPYTYEAVLMRRQTPLALER